SMHYRPYYQHLTTVPPSGQPRGARGFSDSPAGLQPGDIAAAYDSSPFSDAGIQGQQQTIALFELDGYKQSDLTQYFQQYNVPSPNISRQLVDRFSGSAGQG